MFDGLFNRKNKRITKTECLPLELHALKSFEKIAGLINEAERNGFFSLGKAETVDTFKMFGSLVDEVSNHKAAIKKEGIQKLTSGVLRIASDEKSIRELICDTNGQPQLSAESKEYLINFARQTKDLLYEAATKLHGVTKIMDEKGMEKLPILNYSKDSFQSFKGEMEFRLAGVNRDIWDAMLICAQANVPNADNKYLKRLFLDYTYMQHKIKDNMSHRNSFDLKVYSNDLQTMKEHKKDLAILGSEKELAKKQDLIEGLLTRAKDKLDDAIIYAKGVNKPFEIAKEMQPTKEKINGTAPANNLMNRTANINANRTFKNLEMDM